MFGVLTSVKMLLPTPACRKYNNKYFKNRNDENKIHNRDYSLGSQEDHISKSNSHGNTLVLKLKNLFVVFNIIACFITYIYAVKNVHVLQILLRNLSNKKSKSKQKDWQNLIVLIREEKSCKQLQNTAAEN